MRPNSSTPPDLSIVIVNWNVRDLLYRCLRSILRPASETIDPSVDLEVIVVDNASQDGSVEMVRSDFASVKLIVNTENRGFTGGNNQGLEAARGRYVLLLNPDTEIPDGTLAALVHHMDTHPDVGLIGPQLRYPDERIQPSRRRFPTLATLFLESTWLEPLTPCSLLERYRMLDKPEDEVLDVDWVVGAAMLARQDTIRQVGGLDPTYFMYSEEMDWCRRIKGMGWRVAYDPTVHIIHHEGKSSEQAVPTRHINFQRSKIQYTQKYHGRVPGALLRLYLLSMYVWQLGLEWIKGLVGHKGHMRRQRVRAYWQVLKSGL